jgi:hypothetical protein
MYDALQALLIWINVITMSLATAEGQHKKAFQTASV